MNKMKFAQLGLEETLLKSIELLGYQYPTMVQARVIPELLKNQDLVIKSQTGSGKTAAFGIPILHQVNWEDNAPQVLVLTPTRELAEQVKEELFNIGRFKRMKVVAVYGKTPIRSQIKTLKEKVHVVVGTPGRVQDHIDRGTLNLSNIKYFVLDEADEMLNMGFVEQIEDIIRELPKDHVTTLLSATMPEKIASICERYMNDPVFIEMEQDVKKPMIDQSIYEVTKGQKLSLLFDITTIVNPDTCIIFCNTRNEVDTVSDALRAKGYPSDKLHGGMEQDDRTKVMNRFRKGQFRYLVATDVAARGIDIDNISLVVNYELPEEPEIYVHRIGRTGRKGDEGLAIAFVSPSETGLLKSIESLIEEKITLKTAPTVEEVMAKKPHLEEKLDREHVVKEDKSAALDAGILKLHINAGKKTKMRAGDVVGALCSIEGMTADDIGIINIVDVSTFVEILNHKGEGVYKALQNTMIKGRLRKVSKANE